MMKDGLGSVGEEVEMTHGEGCGRNGRSREWIGTESGRDGI